MGHEIDHSRLFHPSRLVGASAPMLAPQDDDTGVVIINESHFVHQAEAKAMTDMTYNSEADAVYIYLGQGPIDSTVETGPLIYDVDAEGRIVGIEILDASKVIAPGDWQKARMPGNKAVSAAS